MDWIADLRGLTGWGTVAVVFLAGGAATAAVQATRDVVLEYLRQRKSRKADLAYALRPIDVLHDADLLYQILDDLRVSVKASRVALCRQENGGKLPTVGQRLTSSVDLEAHSDDARSTKVDWQGQTLDHHYVRLLVDVDEQGGVAVRCGDAKGILRGYMLRHEAAEAHFFPVYSTPGAFFYVVVSYGPDEKPNVLADAVYRDLVRAASGKVCTILAGWYAGIERVEGWP